MFLLLYSINQPDFNVMLLLLCEIFDNIILKLYVNHAVMSRILKLTLIKPYFLHEEKVNTKMLIFLKRNKLLR